MTKELQIPEGWDRQFHPDTGFSEAITIVRRELNSDKDPGSTWHGYQSNIACTLHDNMGSVTGRSLSMAKCNVLADSIMEHIFRESEEDE